MPDRIGQIAEAIEALLIRRSVRTDGRADIVVGLIGRGIQLSRTPSMHEREAARLGMSCSYMLIDFDAMQLGDEDIEPTLRAVARLGFNGVNVTYPFKQAVIPLIDDVAPEAVAIGAVNTVVFAHRTMGHNTDCWGFAESFRDHMAGASLERVAIFGAGGAGSAVSAALIGLGAREITLVDPDRTRATQLALRLSGNDSVRVRVADDVQDTVVNASGIVNTTPIGMAKHPGTPFATNLLRREQWVADVIYFPRETELLSTARATGCRTLPGMGMAIGQAVKSFEYFTGRAADMTAMAMHFEDAA